MWPVGPRQRPHLRGPSRLLRCGGSLIPQPPDLGYGTTALLHLQQQHAVVAVVGPLQGVQQRGAAGARRRHLQGLHGCGCKPISAPGRVSACT